MQKKAFGATAQELGPRRVRVRCSTEAVDRAGDVVVQAGIMHAASVPVLWSHNPDFPIGRAYPAMAGGVLVAEVEFAPEGVCEHADRICGLVKAGVINTVSIGFDPMKSEPMQAALPKGPQRYLQSELLELSFVSVPANAEAEVIARSRRGRRTKGLYEVQQLAGILSQLSWLEECVEAEAAREGDGSPLPETLGRIMAAMGAALIDMTTEEVQELLAIEATEAGALARSRKPAAVRFRQAVRSAMGSVPVSRKAHAQARLRALALGGPPGDVVSVPSMEVMRRRVRALELVHAPSPTVGHDDTGQSDGQRAKAARERLAKLLS